MDVSPERTLDEAIRQRLDKEQIHLGSAAVFGRIALRVRRLTPAGRVEQVGMAILPEGENSGEDPAP
jgi:hypothetical protein